VPYNYRITESKLSLTVTGARDVSVQDINETLKGLDALADGTLYQIFDAAKIAGPNHIYYAAANADFAMRNGLNISDNLNVETLLYAACENQINKAIRVIGVSKKTETVAVAVLSKKGENELSEALAAKLGSVDDSVLDITPEKYESIKELYGITEAAIDTVGADRNEALTSLISEKGSLISLRR
jgi:tRNA threonylcarbamoyladenosine modification (KEOPS) complex Cgi121 subunit